MFKDNASKETRVVHRCLSPDTSNAGGPRTCDRSPGAADAARTRTCNRSPRGDSSRHGPACRSPRTAPDLREVSGARVCGVGAFTAPRASTSGNRTVAALPSAQRRHPTTVQLLPPSRNRSACRPTTTRFAPHLSLSICPFTSFLRVHHWMSVYVRIPAPYIQWRISSGTLACVASPLCALPYFYGFVWAVREGKRTFSGR